MLERERLALEKGGAVAGAGDKVGEPLRISAVAPPGGAMADKVDCGLRIEDAAAGASPLVSWLALSVSSNDNLVFMVQLKHGFGKTTSHRGYKMHGQKRGS